LLQYCSCSVSCPGDSSPRSSASRLGPVAAESAPPSSLRFGPFFSFKKKNENRRDKRGEALLVICDFQRARGRRKKKRATHFCGGLWRRLFGHGGWAGGRVAEARSWRRCGHASILPTCMCGLNTKEGGSVRRQQVWEAIHASPLKKNIKNSVQYVKNLSNTQNYRAKRSIHFQSALWNEETQFLSVQKKNLTKGPTGYTIWGQCLLKTQKKRQRVTDLNKAWEDKHLFYGSFNLFDFIICNISQKTTSRCLACLSNAPVWPRT